MSAIFCRGCLQAALRPRIFDFRPPLLQPACHPDVSSTALPSCNHLSLPWEACFDGYLGFALTCKGRSIQQAHLKSHCSLHRTPSTSPQRLDECHPYSTEHESFPYLHSQHFRSSKACQKANCHRAKCALCDCSLAQYCQMMQSTSRCSDAA